MFESPHQNRKQKPPLGLQAKRGDTTASHELGTLSKNTSTPCRWCSRIKLAIHRKKMATNGPLFQDLFHSHCDCCLENDLLPSSTCGFCRHMNFKHLFERALSYDEFPDIYSDWYCKEGVLSECQFCKLVATKSQHKGISRVSLSVVVSWIAGDASYLRVADGPGSGMSFPISTHPWPQIGDKVDWKRIRTWPLIPSRRMEDLPREFRVIDVARNCIFCPKNPVNYVALSYVWGRTSKNEFQATIRNIKQLDLEESLSRIQLPRTIQDAMFTCRQLGRRYLWVDRLCIVQDDKDSKHGQIAHMDRIFGNAVFTIVALTGSNSQSGLAGVSRRRPTRLKTLQWPGFNLIEDGPHLESLVTKSTWNKRGWTFQEELCSGSNLYFTDYGVYLSRHQSDRRSWKTISECYPHQDTLAPDPTTPLRFIEQFTARSFSFPDDILRACTGVLNRIHGHEHHFGVPFDNFAEGINWRPLEWTHERRTSLTEVFPSWSWSSAQGPVTFKSCLLAVCLWALPVPSDSGKNGTLQWISRKDSAGNLKCLTVNAEEEPKGFLLSPSSLSVFDEHDRRRAHERPGRILSLTQLATFSILKLHYQFPDRRCTFSIMSARKEFVGGIWLTAPSTEDVKGDNGVLKKEPFEFLALSIEYSNFDMQDIIFGTGRDDRPDSFATEVDEILYKMEAKFPPKLVSVMLIVRDEVSGVARRLGIGQVFEKAWQEAKPELKTVVLE